MPGSVASPRLRLADHVSAEVRPEAALEAGPAEDPQLYWLRAFRSVRAETERRAALLSPEDQVIQSMPEASPTKWHRAHVKWFFEQFLLRPHLASYRVFDERFAFLYNSYYVSAGPRQARPQRGLITRPSMAEVADYRAHVDEAITQLIAGAENFDDLAPVIEIGLQHEQQHQELL